MMKHRIGGPPSRREIHNARERLGISSISRFTRNGGLARTTAREAAAPGAQEKTKKRNTRQYRDLRALLRQQQYCVCGEGD